MLVVINEPEPIFISETSSDYSGYGVSCHGADNGFINIEVGGGATDNYSYSWT